SCNDAQYGRYLQICSSAETGHRQTHIELAVEKRRHPAQKDRCYKVRANKDHYENSHHRGAEQFLDRLENISLFQVDRRMRAVLGIARLRPATLRFAQECEQEDTKDHTERSKQIEARPPTVMLPKYTAKCSARNCARI